ncbi:MAG: hypothetical protein GC185_10415 [Alphaproteobacteria bacterium]|nr:hypothetical protein [Alphaproteobacteria bacterium]
MVRNEKVNLACMRPVSSWMMPAAVIILALVVAPQARAQTVTTNVVTRDQPAKTGERIVNFMDFDLNGDGVLSNAEVGEMLFKLFDDDGNDVIDNVEFSRKNLLTVIPAMRQTTVSYDFNNDGVPDRIDESGESFIKETQLSRFDKAHDGLSPQEFSGKTFRQMDVNGDKAIDKIEWQASYVASIAADFKAHKDSIGLNK